MTFENRIESDDHHGGRSLQTYLGYILSVWEIQRGQELTVLVVLYPQCFLL